MRLRGFDGGNYEEFGRQEFPRKVGWKSLLGHAGRVGHDGQEISIDFFAIFALFVVGGVAPFLEFFNVIKDVIFLGLFIN